MLYLLAMKFAYLGGVTNLFTYHTVRAGGAAFTGFVLCLLVGPAVIRWLRAVKIGQYIREEHVADLHELHKGKAGTPTMGGTLIILTTLLSLLLWADLTNRLLLIAVVALCVLGGVGFLDDYLKIRRKHNMGLSAKGKFIAQITLGIAMGTYLVYNPVAVDGTYLTPNCVEDWSGLAKRIQPGSEDTVAGILQPWLHPDNGPALQRMAAGESVSPGHQQDVLMAFHRAFDQDAFATDVQIDSVTLSPEGVALAARARQELGRSEQLRLNRLVLEATAPDAIRTSAPHIHTKVNVPGLKDLLVPLGLGYILFVTVIIVASSNAVNLTDGLDGLAIGASIMSLLAYTGIAYIVSRVDWSQYLFLTYVPDASELTVFGAAMLGTGLGFLWFNSHPAEVFMGDTGSLALGGAIGTMAILTKQELLLVLVGGLFVLEAASVIIQVGSFKLRGKRVFRMAPLHHHFELMGWSESKVTVRFWILALLFALMSLVALKLR
jgi:UDP-N-acetylmuramyl pentapeptide phosphotransferase/UDP-N-acetylglucosamine-1-phosphate transferase